ncbi:hypothetical protein Ahy_A09g041785 isoform A [Arachis hypogaea]|uniref:Uncharacterized protein n=1 Tax=Arachis hypogaea TaxID=3818 RepID=A0A445BDY3_ARAHY|nr:hypothetical protein Ahy_A09g041785 isoform A [Arachis hypogaea]
MRACLLGLNIELLGSPALYSSEDCEGLGKDVTSSCANWRDVVFYSQDATRGLAKGVMSSCANSRDVELKDFENKRIGELKVIKVFRTCIHYSSDKVESGRNVIFILAELFDKFLHGSTLDECYSAIAVVAGLSS